MVMILHLMTVAPQKTEELPDQTIPALKIVSNFTFLNFFLSNFQQLESLVSEELLYQSIPAFTIVSNFTFL